MPHGITMIKGLMPYIEAPDLLNEAIYAFPFSSMQEGRSIGLRMYGVRETFDGKYVTINNKDSKQLELWQSLKREQQAYLFPNGIQERYRNLFKEVSNMVFVYEGKPVEHSELNKVPNDNPEPIVVEDEIGGFRWPPIEGSPVPLGTLKSDVVIKPQAEVLDPFLELAKIDLIEERTIRPSKPKVKPAEERFKGLSESDISTTEKEISSSSSLDTDEESVLAQAEAQLKAKAISSPTVLTVGEIFSLIEMENRSSWYHNQMIKRLDLNKLSLVGSAWRATHLDLEQFKAGICQEGVYLDEYGATIIVPTNSKDLILSKWGVPLFKVPDLPASILKHAIRFHFLRKKPNLYLTDSNNIDVRIYNRTCFLVKTKLFKIKSQIKLTGNDLFLLKRSTYFNDLCRSIYDRGFSRRNQFAVYETGEIGYEAVHSWSEP